MSFIPDSSQKAKDRLNPKKDDSQTVAKALPITQSEDFCAELTSGVMDFTPLHGEQFLVAVNTGDRNKPPLLASTMRGPYEFCDMVERVGRMWEDEQHHAMVYVLTQDVDKASSFLDEGTIDYIEANWEDIAFDTMLEATLMDEDTLVIPAGIILADPEED